MGLEGIFSLFLMCLEVFTAGPAWQYGPLGSPAAISFFILLSVFSAFSRGSKNLP